MEIVSLVYYLFDIKGRIDKTKTENFPGSISNIKDYLYQLDGNSKELVKNTLEIDPNIIFVIPERSLDPKSPEYSENLTYMAMYYNDLSMDGKIYLTEKLAKLLQSTNEQDKYTALGIIAHEYNHYLHGDTDKAKTCNNMLLSYFFTFLGLSGLGYTIPFARSFFLKTNIVAKNYGYFRSGFQGFLNAIGKIIIGHVVYNKFIRQPMEFHADVLTHQDPIEHYKLLCGIESYIDDSKYDHFLKNKEYFPKYFGSIFKFVMSWVSAYPQAENRIEQINKVKKELIEQNQILAEKVKSNSVWQ